LPSITMYSKLSYVCCNTLRIVRSNVFSAFRVTVTILISGRPGSEQRLNSLA